MWVGGSHSHWPPTHTRAWSTGKPTPETASRLRSFFSFVTFWLLSPLPAHNRPSYSLSSTVQRDPRHPLSPLPPFVPPFRAIRWSWGWVEERVEGCQAPAEEERDTAKSVRGALLFPSFVASSAVSYLCCWCGAGGRGVGGRGDVIRRYVHPSVDERGCMCDGSCVCV